ncbi:MAG: sigma 54-interacting transcriptional regulator [Alicyclobacillus macrosporangiidus]|uniref:sigma-54 interaction domain-containing protein n=1 Tax=Alicyclobacillus macrosporangiidus TaxID=392015 RepID=UPI0026EB1C84|nr:sigma 54-interacting transcriptional regulator [Alicyclobacillus macrosporangiidus]MCL6599870.1 sigma 54-interacting transcriptional regulator [Alicyclobacillus macrosporangiidus]
MTLRLSPIDDDKSPLPIPPDRMEAEFQLLGLLDTPMLWIGADGFITWYNRSALDLFPSLSQGIRWEDLGNPFSHGYIYRVHPMTLNGTQGMLVECIGESDSALRQEVEELRRTNAELESILNAVDELYITDGTGITLRVNKDMEKYYGLGSEAFIGRSVFELEKERVFYPSATAIVLRSKKPTTVLQRTKDGRLLVVNAVPVFDDEGHIVRVISSATNITHMKWPSGKDFFANPPTSDEPPHSTPVGQVTAGTPAKVPWIADSEAMSATMDLVNRVAPTDTTVLLLGETGVGKNRIARLIHERSPRRNGPFVEINCAAIPESLLESELFGYERGAFTGARKEGKPGKVDTAQGGTLFLNEIGELPPSLQGKLLDLLQDRTVARIGSLETHTVDVRIVAATNRNLQEMVEQGLFRQDLYYRLTVFPIEVPPLRNRPEDIPLLASACLQRCAARWGTPAKTLHSETIRLLQSYSWPGNIRELENLMERMAITTDDICILPEHLPDAIRGGTFNPPTPSFTAEEAENETSAPPNGADLSDSLSGMMGSHLGLKQMMSLIERRIFEEAAQRWNSTYAIAKRLQVSQPTVVRKLREFGIQLHRKP